MRDDRNAQRSTLNVQRSNGHNFIAERSAFAVSVPLTPNSSFQTPPSRFGFTLFELLAVITIVGLVLAVSLGSFHGWGDAQAVRGSVEVVEAALEHARDYAMTQRVPVSFSYETGTDNTNGIKKIAVYRLATSNDQQPIGVELQRLPGGAWIVPRVPVSFNANAIGRFVFSPNGSVSNAIPGQTFSLLIVSRKMRDVPADTPSIIYRIKINPANGSVSSEKCNPNDATTYIP